MTDYIKPELLILVPVLYILGEIMKHTERIKDNYIPAILGAAGILLAFIYVTATEGIALIGVFTAITQGILVAGAAVYADQIVKQNFGK